MHAVYSLPFSPSAGQHFNLEKLLWLIWQSPRVNALPRFRPCDSLSYANYEEGGSQLQQQR